MHILNSFTTTRQKLFQAGAAPTSDKVVNPASTNFHPIGLIELELGEELPRLETIDLQTGRHYQRIQVLIRLHTLPLGMVELALPPEGLAPQQYVSIIWQNLAQEINQHLREDGLTTLSTLGEKGVLSDETPACLRARANFLAQYAPFTSVIVCTRDRPDQLKICLEFLLKLDYPSYEVLVVDNAPRSEATKELVENHFSSDSRVRYVREVRPGLSWARNRGLQEARGEIVVNTDDDIRVDRHWLTEMVRGFKAGENVACVSGLILPGELETQAQEWFEQFASFNFGYKSVINNIKTHRQKDPLYPYSVIRFGPGGNSAYPAQILRKLKGFNPALGAGSLARACEDNELYFRLLNKGYTSVYTPAALVYHYHRRDYSDLRKQVYSYGTGFVCFFIQSIIKQPKWFFLLIPKIPTILAYLANPQSAEVVGKPVTYPEELKWLKLKGMLYGPIAFVRSTLRRYKLELFESYK